jgi:hypothetical protein
VNFAHLSGLLDAQLALDDAELESGRYTEDD